ncbi:MAG TPA: hypothetical protein PKJ68_04825 [Candidatus Woesebacteria bacterium]|nr:hypothetical protein [Candidatus Woesebacteria bacterium]
MTIELCKFAGGTCDLCTTGTVCRRTPPVDHAVVRGYKEDHRRTLPFPTCRDYEGNWLRLLPHIKELISDGQNGWHALGKDGSILLDVYPHVTLDVSRWFGNVGRTVITTLLEKNPRHIQDYFSFGAQNGLALCHGVPFAVSTRGSLLVTRPVVLSQRQQMLDRYYEFENKFGTVYRAP